MLYGNYYVKVYLTYDIITFSKKERLWKLYLKDFTCQNNIKLLMIWINIFIKFSRIFMSVSMAPSHQYKNWLQ